MGIILSDQNAIRLCARALKCNDERLVEHGSRVGYFACKIARKLPRYNFNEQYLYLLSLFHDIGAYKTEEINNLVKFETVDVIAHSVYGYLFLKHLTPLKEYANAILYHHFGYKNIPDIGEELASYAKLINIADRIDIGTINAFDNKTLINRIAKHKSLDPKFVMAAQEMLLEEDIDDGNLPERINIFSDTILGSLSFSKNEAESYLLMMIYSIDFKSPATMLHSVNTTAVALFIAERLGINEYSKDQLYTAALIHDIGKVTTPTSILEHNGRLTDSQMEIMKLHVIETARVLKGLMDDETINIAARHHEKLDGSGYPKGLKGEELTLSDKVVAVADITSALLGKRSYKDSYGWSKTINILNEMVEQGKLDADIVKLVVDNFLDLQDYLEESASPVKAKYNDITKEYHSLVKDHGLPPVFYG